MWIGSENRRQYLEENPRRSEKELLNILKKFIEKTSLCRFSSASTDKVIAGVHRFAFYPGVHPLPPPPTNFVNFIGVYLQSWKNLVHVRFMHHTMHTRDAKYGVRKFSRQKSFCKKHFRSLILNLVSWKAIGDSKKNQIIDDF